MPSRRLVLASLILVACTRTAPETLPPASCITHDRDGHIEQCFDFVGADSRRFGARTCQEMELTPLFQDGRPCPVEKRVGTCARRMGTPLASSERCYRDAKVCKERCASDGGSFSP